MRVLKHSILRTNSVLPLQVTVTSYIYCSYFSFLKSVILAHVTLKHQHRSANYVSVSVLHLHLFSASPHENAWRLSNKFWKIQAIPFSKIMTAELFFLATKTMALEGRTQGDRNQNNVKHLTMHNCILEHTAQLTHQFIEQIMLPSSQVWKLFCWKWCSIELKART